MEIKDFKQDYKHFKQSSILLNKIKKDGEFVKNSLIKHVDGNLILLTNDNIYNNSICIIPNRLYFNKYENVEKINGILNKDYKNNISIKYIINNKYEIDQKTIKFLNKYIDYSIFKLNSFVVKYNDNLGLVIIIDDNHIIFTPIEEIRHIENIDGFSFDPRPIIDDVTNFILENISIIEYELKHRYKEDIKKNINKIKYLEPVKLINYKFIYNMIICRQN